MCSGTALPICCAASTVTLGPRSVNRRPPQSSQLCTRYARRWIGCSSTFPAAWRSVRQPSLRFAPRSPTRGGTPPCSAASSNGTGQRQRHRRRMPRRRRLQHQPSRLTRRRSTGLVRSSPVAARATSALTAAFLTPSSRRAGCSRCAPRSRRAGRPVRAWTAGAWSVCAAAPAPPPRRPVAMARRAASGGGPRGVPLRQAPPPRPPPRGTSSHPAARPSPPSARRCAPLPMARPRQAASGKEGREGSRRARSLQRARTRRRACGGSPRPTSRTGRRPARCSRRRRGLSARRARAGGRIGGRRALHTACSRRGGREGGAACGGGAGGEGALTSLPSAPKELLWDRPWALLLACILLNQTTRRQVPLQRGRGGEGEGGGPPRPQRAWRGSRWTR